MMDAMTRGSAVLPARPAATRSASVPGPGSPVDDAILRARLKNKNLEPFTAQHSAAYAAFAGIDDRSTALRLHRNGVTWDDVNDYTGPKINPSQYATMIDLANAGVTPKDLHRWLAMEARVGLLISVPDIQRLARAGVSVEQAETFYGHASTGWTSEQIATLVPVGLSPEDTMAYGRAGIVDANQMATLTNLGAAPPVVQAFRAALAADPQVSPTVQTRSVNPVQFGRGFLAYCSALSTALSSVLGERSRDLLAIAAASALTDVEIKGWVDTGLPVERIRAYVAARVRLDEWTNDPTVREVPADTLAALAALSTITIT